MRISYSGAPARARAITLTLAIVGAVAFGAAGCEFRDPQPDITTVEQDAVDQDVVEQRTVEQDTADESLPVDEKNGLGDEEDSGGVSDVE